MSEAIKLDSLALARWADREGRTLAREWLAGKRAEPPEAFLEKAFKTSALLAARRENATAAFNAEIGAG